MIVPVVICGGAGSRLWPASREALPKQFISLIGEESMFQKTLARVRDPQFASPVIVTHSDFAFLVASQMMQVGVKGEVLLEPTRRDSCMAIAAAAAHGASRHSGALMLVLPADHLVQDVEAFRAAVRRGADAAAAGRIVTFGLLPDRPATGYGYIHPELVNDNGHAVVSRFVEKPDETTAVRYIEQGFLWNSGMFLFQAQTFLAELERYQPEVTAAAQASVSGARPDLGFLRLDPAAYEAAPKVSVDYALMEKTRLASVVPAAFGWSDVGSWSSVWDASPRDAAGNATSGDVTVHESRNCYVQTSGPLTVLVGMEDVVVVVEDDAVMVARRDAAESVKSVVQSLKDRSHPSAVSSRRVYRPWGYFQTLDLGTRFQVKRIVVDPGQKLSLQSHHHRAEHWVVVSGTAVVTRDEETLMVRENESVYLPLGCVHRLANPGKIPLEIIEVQSGSYLGEDDIVRYEDVYARV